MPVYENETYVQGLFRVTYPQVAAWLEAGNSGVAASDRVLWTRSRRLTGLVAEDIARIIREHGERFATDPAEAWDCMNIPNGRYVVTENPNEADEQEYDFSIHLVQNGTLAGKRVVRYKFPGQRTYKAFAWLTKNGQLSLWRAFRNDANADYVRVAIRLLDSLRSGMRETVLNTSARGSWFFGFPREERRSENFRIVPQVRCFHCSGLLDTPEQHYAQHCEAHMPPPRTQVARRVTTGQVEYSLTNVQIVDPDLERLLNEEEEVERRNSAGRQAIEEARQRAAQEAQRNLADTRARRAAVRASVASGGRTTPLPMCEITGSEVQ